MANRSVEDLVGLVGYMYVCLVETLSVMLVVLVVYMKLAVLANFDSAFDRLIRSKNILGKP